MTTLTKSTHFSLSVEKGLRGNIGKMREIKTRNGAYLDMMLFLVANSDAPTDDRLVQIVNAHFPQEAIEVLNKDYEVSDYVRVHFDRIDLTKGIDDKTGEEKLYISAKANGIELLKRTEKKEVSLPENKNQQQEEQEKQEEQKANEKSQTTFWGQSH